MAHFCYISITKKYPKYQGASERVLKTKLVKEGWEVWRGGVLRILDMEEVYPNVYRKYMRLKSMLGSRYDELRYLCHVHHGMPDYICFRRGFKFVECKLGHEQLISGQRRCIKRLIKMGYTVEVHKLAFPRTKDRVAYVDSRGNKKVCDK